MSIAERCVSAIKEVIPMQDLSTKEIEHRLGLDNVKPITLSAGDEKDTIEKGDCFRGWYEDELREFYAKTSCK